MRSTRKERRCSSVNTRHGQMPTHPPTAAAAAAAAVARSWWWGMAWLVWNGVVVDGFEGGRHSVPSSLLRFYPARCACISPCCCCVCSPCGRGRAGRPCPAKSPPIKVVCLTSPPSPRAKESTAQATPKRRWYSDKSEKRASLLQEDHLNWPINQITVIPSLTL